MNREQFLKELAVLDHAFSTLQPELELTVRDPEMDVEGYVVVWSSLAAKNGPLGRCGKGGTRITPNVSLDEIKMLARIMTLKNAAAGLPLGGAKSGMKGNPDAPDFEKRYRRFVSLVKPVLRENGGVFGGFGFDIGGRPQHPIWACDELQSRRSFTGKPLNIGGTDYDSEGIAGLGVATAAKTLVEIQKSDISRTTFAVQGIGAMGAAVIRYFTEYGAKLVAFSDPRIGGTYVGSVGPELISSLARGNVDETNRLITNSKLEKLGVDDVLYQKVDVLFPSAVQDVITVNNVDRILAKMISEGANNPCTAEARTKLFQRGVQLIPDFIANPGGIIAAFVEMLTENETSNDPRYRPERAKTFTREKISENVHKLMQIVNDYKVEPAQAGRYIALKNIFNR